MYDFIRKDKEFYSTLIRIAIPIVVQNFIASSLNMVDTVMIGQMGETEIASVGLANQIFFLLNLFLFGISSGAAIFTAQFWGKRDVANIRRVLGMGLISGIAISAVFTLIAMFAPKQVLSLFSKDKDVILLGSQYLRIVALSYVITSITFSYAFILRSTEQVKVPMFISMVALSTNTALNYVLIFGNFGFPALGVRGAAIATVFARVMEVVLIIFITYRKQFAPAASISEMLDVSRDFVIKFFKTTVPVVMNESLWAFGVTMYSVVYARMGTGVIASINIFSTIERMFFVVFFGMAHSCAVMVGNTIGSGDENKAFAYARKFAIMGPVLGIIMGMAVILLSNPMLSIYNVSSEVNSAAKGILGIFAFIAWIKVFNAINIVGILRSGGDTKFSLFIDTFGVWFIAVPLAFLGGLVWKLPVPWVYALISLEEVFKFTLGVRRFVSKKWINNLTNQFEYQATV